MVNQSSRPAPSSDASHRVEWRVSDEPVPYEEAVAVMEERAAAIAAGEAPELVCLPVIRKYWE